jgi:pimeloyl-ACP methyl ester carboxylesterase
MSYPTLISHQQWTGIIMFWEKASQKSRKGKPIRIAAFDGVRLVGLFSIIILILLVAPIAAMGAPPQPPGKLVDVGGSVGINMHIYCTGEGNPTVVLDAGANGGTMSWAKVQEQVSNHTRVCSYDRAGMSWSEEGPKPRTFMRIADELHALLQTAGEEGPYVLVGHSVGAHTIRFLVQGYPTDIAGIVLVDPAHEKILSTELIPVIEQIQRTYVGYAHGGFWRYVLNPDFIMGVEGPDVPVEIINNLEVVYSAKSLSTAADELAAMYETVRALNATNIGGAWSDKPTIVLSADNEIAHLTGALEHHKELASLSTRGEQILVQGGHNIHYEHPGIVAEAILNIVNTVRQGI